QICQVFGPFADVLVARGPWFRGFAAGRLWYDRCSAMPATRVLGTRLLRGREMKLWTLLTLLCACHSASRTAMPDAAPPDGVPSSPDVAVTSGSRLRARFL